MHRDKAEPVTSSMQGTSPARDEPSEKLSLPTYAGVFQCIGPSCEDTCCTHWDIPLDKVTYQRYRQFPKEKLGSLVSHFVSVNPGAAHENIYAAIHQTSSGECPFFGEDRLCGIQKEYGAGLLSATCSQYPRYLSRVDGRLEGTLSLSCPEAARLVLLSPSLHLLESDLHTGGFRTDNVFHIADRAEGRSIAPARFLAMRSLLIALVQDRSRPLWQRVLMVAAFCKCVDELADPVVEGLTPLMDHYRATLGQGSYAELESMPRDLQRRLELILALSTERSADPRSGQRFRDTFWDFVEGIGSAESADPGEDLKRFESAERDFFEPFLNAHPFLLENYLVNYMLQHMFPLGQAGSDRFLFRSAFEESLLLVLQFSWVSTLLVGVAGNYRESFAQAHIVSTVQSFTRAVEHVPKILDDGLAALAQRGLDTLAGISILLRS